MRTGLLMHARVFGVAVLSRPPAISLVLYGLGRRLKGGGLMTRTPSQWLPKCRSVRPPPDFAHELSLVRPVFARRNDRKSYLSPECHKVGISKFTAIAVFWSAPSPRPARLRQDLRRPD